jgi:hypothetical protein
MVYEAVLEEVSRPENVLGVRITEYGADLYVAPEECAALDKLWRRWAGRGPGGGSMLYGYRLQGAQRLMPMYADNYLLVASGLISQLEEGSDRVLYHLLPPGFLLVDS